MEITLFDLVFRADHIYAKPIREIKNRELRRLFTFFRRLFPDHPDKNNTWIFILEDENDEISQLLWVCFHFEHGTNPQDLASMSVFAHELAYLSSLPLQINSCGLLYLNDHAEKVIFTVYLDKTDLNIARFRDSELRDALKIWHPLHIRLKEPLTRFNPDVIFS